MLSLTLILGILSIWFAHIIKLPSILILLLVGFAVGPLYDIIRPEELYGTTLYPLISVSIGIILFEGGLSLKMRDLKEVGKPLARILTISALITWGLVTLLSYTLLKLPLSLSILYGAMLIVTGPTVVSPLLQYIRPPKKLYALAHWEGIMIDPVGVLISTLVFEAIYVSENMHGDFFISTLLFAIGKTTALGFIIAYPLAKTYIYLARTSLLTEHLQPLVSVACAIFSFMLSNYYQGESGLFTITLFGLFLSNQNKINVDHIIDFNENLRTLLLGLLFITLAAKLSIHDIEQLNTFSFLFVFLLIVLVRPASIYVGLKGLSFSKKELLFMSAMAPRGIVAASVASIFSNKLGEEAQIFVPITFLVITITVLVYGIGTPILCKILNISTDKPQGVLYIGANEVTRALAKSMQEIGFTVAVVDTNYAEIAKCKMQNIPAYLCNALSEDMLGKIPFSELGNVLVATQGNKSNYIIASHLKSIFKSSHVYQLSPYQYAIKDKETLLVSSNIYLGKEFTFELLKERIQLTQDLRKTKITAEYSYANFKEKLSDSLIMYIVRKDGALDFPKNDQEIKNISSGDLIVSCSVLLS